ncbi:uncharacterized protein LOC135394597 [Ornithodoros turicata]|uniref:uncharacterized protein LOC135394597 n=1 Tax=Ornithodoros turicata TaxID=34597 RepID=UPI003139A826
MLLCCSGLRLKDCARILGVCLLVFRSIGFIVGGVVLGQLDQLVAIIPGYNSDQHEPYLKGILITCTADAALWIFCCLLLLKVTVLDDRKLLAPYIIYTVASNISYMIMSVMACFFLPEVIASVLAVVLTAMCGAQMYFCMIVSNLYKQLQRDVSFKLLLAHAENLETVPVPTDHLFIV